MLDRTHKIKQTRIQMDGAGEEWETNEIMTRHHTVSSMSQEFL